MEFEIYALAQTSFTTGNITPNNPLVQVVDLKAPPKKHPSLALNSINYKCMNF